MLTIIFLFSSSKERLPGRCSKLCILRDGLLMWKCWRFKGSHFFLLFLLLQPFRWLRCWASPWARLPSGGRRSTGQSWIPCSPPSRCSRTSSYCGSDTPSGRGGCPTRRKGTKSPDQWFVIRFNLFLYSTFDFCFIDVMWRCDHRFSISDVVTVVAGQWWSILFRQTASAASRTTQVKAKWIISFVDLEARNIDNKGSWCFPYYILLRR